MILYESCFLNISFHLQSSPNTPTVPSLTDAKLFPVHTTVPIVFPSSIEIELRSDNSMSLPASVRLIIVRLSLFDFLILASYSLLNLSLYDL